MALEDSHEQRVQLFSIMKEKEHCFKLDVESISRDSDPIPMLDVTFFYRGSLWSLWIMSHKIHAKRSSQWVPLETTSFHPQRVHAAWPIAQVQRLWRMCNNTFRSQEETALFISAPRKRGTHFFCMTALQNTDLPTGLSQTLKHLRPMWLFRSLISGLVQALQRS